jgi:CCR4-NOT transcription complex subunit 6
MLSNSASNYTSNGVRNGSPNEDEGDIAEHISEHWQEQLQLAAEQRQAASAAHRHSKKAGAVSSSTKGNAPSVPSDPQKEVESGERYRAAIMSDNLRQDWDGLDLSGQGLRVLAVSLFNNYSFLTKLFIDNNKITSLPPSISQLRSLELLQASNNQLRELPDSIGMLVNLKHLLLFDNNIHTLPCEIGHLHRLEMLGIEGNPLKEEYKEILIQEGTKALIMFIRDSTEGMFIWTHLNIGYLLVHVANFSSWCSTSAT